MRWSDARHRYVPVPKLSPRKRLERMVDGLLVEIQRSDKTLSAEETRCLLGQTLRRLTPTLVVTALNR